MNNRTVQSYTEEYKAYQTAYQAKHYKSLTCKGTKKVVQNLQKRIAKLKREGVITRSIDLIEFAVAHLEKL